MIKRFKISVFIQKKKEKIISFHSIIFPSEFLFAFLSIQKLTRQIHLFDTHMNDNFLFVIAKVEESMCRQEMEIELQSIKREKKNQNFNVK